MKRILVVEDEGDLASLLAYNLSKEGFETEVAATGASAIAKLKAVKPHVVLLDLMLPDVSGVEVLRFIRASEDYASVAVMMLTARTAEADRILGFELGADDYVLKPFSVREVLLRVQALLRRIEPEIGRVDVLTAGSVRLEPGRHEAAVDGVPIILTALEFRLLQTFLERPGRIQSREALLSDVWGIESEIETRTVDSHVKRLRQKLGSAKDFIQTVRGVGYKLVPPSTGTRPSRK